MITLSVNPNAVVTGKSGPIKGAYEVARDNFPLFKSRDLPEAARLALNMAGIANCNIFVVPNDSLGLTLKVPFLEKGKLVGVELLPSDFRALYIPISTATINDADNNGIPDDTEATFKNVLAAITRNGDVTPEDIYALNQVGLPAFSWLREYCGASPEALHDFISGDSEELSLSPEYVVEALNAGYAKNFGLEYGKPAKVNTVLPQEFDYAEHARQLEAVATPDDPNYVAKRQAWLEANPTPQPMNPDGTPILPPSDPTPHSIEAGTVPATPLPAYPDDDEAVAEADQTSAASVAALESKGVSLGVGTIYDDASAGARALEDDEAEDAAVRKAWAEDRQGYPDEVEGIDDPPQREATDAETQAVREALSKVPETVATGRDSLGGSFTPSASDDDGTDALEGHPKTQAEVEGQAPRVDSVRISGPGIKGSGTRTPKGK